MVVGITDGAVDDIAIVRIVDSYDEEDYDRTGMLENIAKNGTTPAVRAAARRALGTNKILGIDQAVFYLILSIAYYTLALGFWVFRYRKLLRHKQFTLGSMFLLTTLIAIGLPLVVATWNAW